MFDEKNNIGEKIRKRRETMGYSLRKLAKMTNLSASFLSQVELNRNSLSLTSLHSIASALDVPMLYFLDESRSRKSSNQQDSTQPSTKTETVEDGYNLEVTKENRNKLVMPKSGVTYELLVPRMGYKMVVFQRRLSPGFDHTISRVLKEPTEEFIYVLNGELLVELTSGSYILRAEDSMYFEGRDLLRFECHSTDEDVVWIAAISPSIF
jgi:transcriptional regulator with XRE-family HTH domain